MTHNRSNLAINNSWNKLNIQNFQTHVTRYAGHDMFHAIYEVIIHTVYRDTYLSHFSDVRNPRSPDIRISTPLPTGRTNHVRYDPQARQA